MSESLAPKSREELVLIGKSVCCGHDWRWVAIWTYNVHRLFRNKMQPRPIWDDLDNLIRAECDWHLGRDLFQSIRRINTGNDATQQSHTEGLYLRLGEITAKCISNASWDTGKYDQNAPWQVPWIAVEICRANRDEKLADYLHNHFTSLSNPVT